MDHENEFTINGSSDNDSGDESTISSFDVESIDSLLSAGSESSFESSNVSMEPPVEANSVNQFIQDPLEVDQVEGAEIEGEQIRKKKQGTKRRRKIGEWDELTHDSNKQTSHSLSVSGIDVPSLSGSAAVQIVPQKVKRRRKSQRILEQQLKKKRQHNSTRTPIKTSKSSSGKKKTRKDSAEKPLPVLTVTQPPSERNVKKRYYHRRAAAACASTSVSTVAQTHASVAATPTIGERNTNMTIRADFDDDTYSKF